MKYKLPDDFNRDKYIALNHFLIDILYNEKGKKLLQPSDIDGQYLTLYENGNKINYNFENIDIIVYSGAKTGSTTLYISYYIL